MNDVGSGRVEKREALVPMAATGVNMETQNVALLKHLATSEVKLLGSSSQGVVDFALSILVGKLCCSDIEGGMMFYALCSARRHVATFCIFAYFYFFHFGQVGMAKTFCRSSL